MTCSTCRHWANAPDESTGGCRRYPPVPHVVPTVAEDGPSFGAVSVWPETDGDDWCGEWRANPTGD